MSGLALYPGPLALDGGGGGRYNKYSNRFHRPGGFLRP